MSFFSSSGGKKLDVALLLGLLTSGFFATVAIMAFTHCCRKVCECLNKVRTNRTCNAVLRLQDLQERRSNIDVNPFTYRYTQQETFQSDVAFITVRSQAPLTGPATSLTTQQINLPTIAHRHTDIFESNTRHSEPRFESRHVSENTHINSFELLQINVDEPPPSYESVMIAEVNSVHMLLNDENIQVSYV